MKAIKNVSRCRQMSLGVEDPPSPQLRTTVPPQVSRPPSALPSCRQRPGRGGGHLTTGLLGLGRRDASVGGQGFTMLNGGIACQQLTDVVSTLKGGTFPKHPFPDSQSVTRGPRGASGADSPRFPRTGRRGCGKGGVGRGFFPSVDIFLEPVAAPV